MMEKPIFRYPKKPKAMYMKDESEKEAEVKPDESDLFMWRRLWDKVNYQAFEYKKIQDGLPTYYWARLTSIKGTTGRHKRL